MRKDLNNWIKQVVLINYDLVNTPLLIDLSQKLKCVHTDLMLSHYRAALHQRWFYHAYMVDHAQPRSPALKFLNPCFKSFPTMPLTSLRHSFGKFWYSRKIESRITLSGDCPYLELQQTSSVYSKCRIALIILQAMYRIAGLVEVNSEDGYSDYVNILSSTLKAWRILKI